MEDPKPILSIVEPVSELKTDTDEADAVSDLVMAKPVTDAEVASDDANGSTEDGPAANSLYINGRAVCLHPSLLTVPSACAVYTLVLAILSLVNVWAFAPTNDYLYAEWWQRIKLLHDVGLLNAGYQILYALCVAFFIALFARCGRTTAVYGRGKAVTIALLPFFALLVIPVVQVVYCNIQSLFSSVDFIFRLYQDNRANTWLLFEKSGLPAASLCWLGSIGLVSRALWRAERTMTLYDDGLAVGLRRFRNLIGERPVRWSDIARVELVSPENGSGIKDSTLLIHLNTGEVLDFRWKEVVNSCDPSELFAALKTGAPHAVTEDLMFHERRSSPSDHSYTELWLKYFTTGAKRERTGKLEDKSALCGGKYSIVGEIGAGGQGTAYLALPASGAAPGHEHVVLKEYIMPLHRGEALFQQSMKKLEQESRILQKIEHPHIVKLLDHFVEDHRGYLVLDYVEGTPLKQLVQAEGRRTEDQVVELAIQVCEILEYLHGMEPAVVHRDLTPDNLILQENGYLKLVDFNVAQQLESGATATVVGKHAYIPPEQFRGRPTAQSDLYALGGTLHFLLTGLEPEPLSPSRPRQINEDVSSDLDAIIARATALDCGKRYARAAEMKADLHLLSLRSKP
ncbi:MAG: serine/threonine protein kinase [Candidatus Obscuribacterales bacterium]|nr:serine/threonine protein kinase [Candidatus Obscuribacterales bacterium]